MLGRPKPAAPRAAPAAPAPSGFHVRICDDLSRPTSFTWISASIALALERIGVRVSIAPTELSASIEPDRRRALEALIERGSAPRATAEVGWTHFWPEYRRPLGGEQPLALFAVNYAFAESSPDGWDPWMRGLVEGSQPLGPISTFCAEVLSKAGVGEERLDVVPLAPTEGVTEAEPAELPRARALKLLHVTNSGDPERHGTDVALAAFREAFSPGDDVTFVVRDYGASQPGLAAAVGRLAAEGYDVRYWPAFYPAHRLGTFLSAFDVLVAPFRGEGFGIKLLDAMACGQPVVGPRFGGPADFLDDDASYVVPHRLEPVRAGADASLLALGTSRCGRRRRRPTSPRGCASAAPTRPSWRAAARRRGGWRRGSRGSGPRGRSWRVWSGGGGEPGRGDDPDVERAVAVGAARWLRSPVSRCQPRRWSSWTTDPPTGPPST